MMTYRDSAKLSTTNIYHIIIFLGDVNDFMMFFIYTNIINIVVLINYRVLEFMSYLDYLLG